MTLLRYLILSLAVSLTANAFTLQMDEPKNEYGKDVGVYNPDDTVRARLLWENNESDTGDNYLYLTFTLPNGKTLYADENGSFSLTPKPYGSVDISTSSNHADLLDFNYSIGEWMPQGSYTVHCWLTQRDPAAREDPARRLSPKMTATFETTSHYIPLTYDSYEKDFVYARHLVTDDGIWIVYYTGQSTQPPHDLYGMKVDPSGRTAIAPFLLTPVDEAYPRTEPKGNVFALVPNDKGGFTVAGTDEYPEGSDRYRLFVYRYDSEGRMYGKKILKADMHDGYRYLWAAATNHGIAVIAYFKYDGKYHLFTVENDTVRNSVLTPELDSSSEETFYKAYYDRTTDKLIFIYGFGGTSGDNHVTFTRYALDGTREVETDITTAMANGSGDFDLYNIGWPGEIFKTSEGYALYRPETVGGGDDSFFLLLIAEDGSITARRSIQGLRHTIYGASKYALALENDTIFHLIARTGSDDYTYARFDKNGTLTVAPTSVWHYPNSNETSTRPTLGFADNRLFATFAHYPLGHTDTVSLSLLFLDYDFPAGKPDLVVSAAGVSQDPQPFATPGYDTDLNITVANRGEAASGAGSLQLDYLGTRYTASYGPLQPGESADLLFTIPQPPYLTSLPQLDGNLTGGDSWTENNRFTAQIYFTPLTPVYPPGSRLYHWQIVDGGDSHPIANAEVLYTLTGTKTVSGTSNDVTMSHYSDSEGRFDTVLPDGGYTFTFFKYGYPHMKLPVTAGGSPEPADGIFHLPPPGDLQLYFGGDDGNDSLHPVPLRVTAEAAHREDTSLYEWQSYRYSGLGSESGLRIRDMMPGEYDANVTVFGYYPHSFTPYIEGGRVNEYNLTLAAKPRGTITGTVVSGGNPVSGATVSVMGIGTGVTTAGDGTFTIGDLPVDSEATYRLLVHKDGYVDLTYPFRVTSENNDLSDIPVRQIYTDTADIDACRYAAWVQDAQWNVKNSYEVKTIYGVWDLSGKVHYRHISGDSTTDIDQIDLDLAGLRWNYADLDGHVIEAFASWAASELASGLAAGNKIVGYFFDAFASSLVAAVQGELTPKQFIDAFFESGDPVFHDVKNVLTTMDDLSDPMGTVRGSVADCGDLDALDGLAAYDPAYPDDETIVRIDDLKVYEGNNTRFRLHDGGHIQYYSDRYRGETIRIPVTLDQELSSMDDLRVSVYLRIQNAHHSTGPLSLVGSDKVRIDFRYDGGKLWFNGILSNPFDYPTF